MNIKTLNVDLPSLSSEYIMNFDVDYPTQQFIHSVYDKQLVCDPPMVETILECVEPDSVMIDVGSHIGHYTLVARQGTGPKGKIYAFDANPDTFLILEKNIASNEYHNIEAVYCAVSNKEGESTFNIVASDEGLSMFGGTEITYANILMKLR